MDDLEGKVIGEDVEALLNATLGVLKAEIKNLSFRHWKLPKGFSASDVDAQIQHEPRFANLGGSTENAQPRGIKLSTQNFAGGILLSISVSPSMTVRF